MAKVQQMMERMSRESRATPTTGESEPTYDASRASYSGSRGYSGRGRGYGGRGRTNYLGRSGRFGGRGRDGAARGSDHKGEEAPKDDVSIWTKALHHRHHRKLEELFNTLIDSNPRTKNYTRGYLKPVITRKPQFC